MALMIMGLTNSRTDPARRSHLSGCSASSAVPSLSSRMGVRVLFILVYYLDDSGATDRGYVE